MAWDGVERRLGRGSSDHDILIRMEQKLDNHLESFNSHKLVFDDHVKDDKKNFERIDKVIWVGSGMVTIAVALVNWMFRK